MQPDDFHRQPRLLKRLMQNVRAVISTQIMRHESSFGNQNYREN